MGSYREDEEEYLRQLRKYYDDRQFLDWLELLVSIAPDAAVAYLGESAIIAAGTVTGFALGQAIGALFGPVGMLASSAIGAAAGYAVGVKLGSEFESWYLSASTEDRARARALGVKIGAGGVAVLKFVR